MNRPTLKRSSNDPAVKELQALLNCTGALLEVDGNFGRLTEAAVREAQQEAGLPVTGIVDQPL